MKLFHLSDLHIGKQLHHYNLAAEQRKTLAQIVALAKSEHPDAILIAGDIYDTPVPSAEAVSVFDAFLSALCEIEPQIAVMIIAGNHDSARRIDFASSILAKHEVYITGLPPMQEGETIRRVTLADGYGEVDFYLLPFVKPSMVREIVGTREDGTQHSYDEALHLLIERENIDTKERNVLVSHQFYLPSGRQAEDVERMDSEIRTVGNIDEISADVLEVFDYAALGHIHKPMKVGSEYYCYCGTPLACSVSEAGQKKGIVMVTMKEKGNISTEVLPLPPLRQVRVIKGEFQEVLSQACEDYVTVVLTDKEDLDVIDLKDRLRNAFPYLLEIRRERERRAEYKRQSRKIEELDPFELCCSFLGEHMDEEEREMLLDVISSVQGVK